MKLVYFLLFTVMSCQSFQFKQQGKNSWACTERKPHLKREIQGQIGAAVDGYEKAATCYYYSGKLDLAEMFYEKALKEKPRNLNALLGLARIYEGRGKTQKASSFYDQLFQYYPENVKLWRFYTSYALLHYDLIEAAKGIQILKKGSYQDLSLFYHEVLLKLRGEREKVVLSKDLLKKYPDNGLIFSYMAYLNGDRVLGGEILNRFKPRLSMNYYHILKSFWENL